MSHCTLYKAPVLFVHTILVKPENLANQEMVLERDHHLTWLINYKGKMTKLGLDKEVTRFLNKIQSHVGHLHPLPFVSP